MLMACTVAHSFSIVTVLDRTKPLLDDVVRRYGMEARCTSVRATGLAVLDIDRDPDAAGRRIVEQAHAAVEEERAEAILLGYAGMGPWTARSPRRSACRPSTAWWPRSRRSRACTTTASARAASPPSHGPSIESHHPLRVDRYELREDATGAGRWRGGVGSIRDITFLADARFSVEGGGHRHPPPGLFGGRDGTSGALVLNPGRAAERPLPSKIPDVRTRAGETVRTVGPCGGGYGDPLERDPARVLDDVLDGIVSPESALRDHGVVVAGGAVDAEATARERAGRRAGGAPTERERTAS